MPLKLEKAKRGAIWLRVAIFAETGEGKTYSALAVGHHLCDLHGWDPSESLAVLDTELVESPDRKDALQGSAEKYDGRPCNCEGCHREGLRFSFLTLKMPTNERHVDAWLQAMTICKQAGVKVLLIDSASHEWESILRLVDSLRSQGGRQQDPWGKATAQHDRFIQAVLNYPGHVIFCMRAKRKYDRNVPKGESYKDLGIQPIQRDNVLYEFDIGLYMQSETAYVVKTRNDLMANQRYGHPGHKLALDLYRWAQDPDQVQAARAEEAQNPPPAVAAGSPEAPKTAPKGKDAPSGNVNGNGKDTPEAALIDLEHACAALAKIDVEDPGSGRTGPELAARALDYGKKKAKAGSAKAVRDMSKSTRAKAAELLALFEAKAPSEPEPDQAAVPEDGEDDFAGPF